MMTVLSAAQVVENVYRDKYSEVGNKILTGLDERAAQEKAKAKEDAYMKPTMVKRAVVDFFVKSATDQYKDVTLSKQKAQVERAKIAEYKARQAFKKAEVRLSNANNKPNIEQFREEKIRAQAMHDAMQELADEAKKRLTAENALLDNTQKIVELENSKKELEKEFKKRKNIVDRFDNRTDIEKEAARELELRYRYKEPLGAYAKENLTKTQEALEKVKTSIDNEKTTADVLVKNLKNIDSNQVNLEKEKSLLQKADKKIKTIDKQVAKLEEEKRVIGKTADQKKSLDDKILQLKENRKLEEAAFKPKIPEKPIIQAKGPAPVIPAKPSSMQKQIEVKQEIKPVVDEEAMEKRLNEKQKIHDDLQEQKLKSAARLEEIINKMKDPKLNPMDRVDLGIEKSRLIKDIPVLDEKFQAVKADLNNVQKEVVELERVRQIDEEQKSKSSKPAQADVQEKNMLEKLIDDPIPKKTELRPVERMTEERKTRILENYKKKQPLEKIAERSQNKDEGISLGDKKHKTPLLTPAEIISRAREREAEREQKLIAPQKIVEEKKQKADKKLINRLVNKVKITVKKPAVHAKPTVRVIAH